MIVKLLTEHHLEFISLKEEAQTRLSLHLSKCQIVGNLMPRLKFNNMVMRFQSPLVYFENTESQIYPTEHQLNKANTSDTKASFLDFAFVYFILNCFCQKLR